MSNYSDETNWALDYSDITDIFKNSLKIESSLKSIQAIFKNERYLSKINYKPYFQRNYVWDVEKASYFIESILLGTEIPPLVLFKGTTQENEVIDGRQRFETLKNFMSNDLKLESKGLRLLESFSGLKYTDLINLGETIEDDFMNTRIRILQCSVSNEPSLSVEKEDKIKKEIFKRYNSGITPLKKEENARAEYLDDPITKQLNALLVSDKQFFESSVKLLLLPSKQRLAERDKINNVADRIRSIITLTELPIYDYAKSSRRSDIIRPFYSHYFSASDAEDIVGKIKTVVGLLAEIQKNIPVNLTYNNALLYETFAWALLILLKNMKSAFEVDTAKIANDIMQSEQLSVFWDEVFNSEKTSDAIFFVTGSHYRNTTIDRYRFVSNYLTSVYGYDFNLFIKNPEKSIDILDKNYQSKQLNESKLKKPDPVSVTIDDILSDMKRNKFLIRPDYQRSEVVNLGKSSYLIESIMLGIKIPHIYIYKRTDRVKEVIDGQQRLLTIIGFIGETYVNDEGKKASSEKHKFTLKGLKILKALNGLNFDQVKEKHPQYIDNIMDFSIDIVEIDASNNPDFNSIDLFLRLNTKPFPIKPNSFEMWNAYVSKSITEKIKEISKSYDGKILRANDARMVNEELITALAYLDFQKNTGVHYKDLLAVYIRQDSVSTRIASKSRITKTLESLNVNSTSKFMESIENVNSFFSKLQHLVGAEGKKFFDLLGTSQKTSQNFYFLWVMLENVTEEYIITNTEVVYKKIQGVFKGDDSFNTLKPESSAFDPKTYIDSISNLICSNDNSGN